MKWIVRLLMVLGALVPGVWFFRESLLNVCFSALVISEPPSKADLAVVLGGDGYGKRLLTAAQLVRDGYVPFVLVDGPGGAYDEHECDLAIRFGVSHGFPESYFRHFPGDFTNTADEATAVIGELRKENAKKVLIVTSAFHTRRASRYFYHLPGIEAHMIAAPDQYANSGTWWQDREGRKTVFLEYAKTVATWFGI